MSQHHIQGTDCKQGDDEPRDQEYGGSQRRELPIDVLYGAQLCVHQFRTIGGRKSQMRAEQRYR